MGNGSLMLDYRLNCKPNCCCNNRRFNNSRLSNNRLKTKSKPGNLLKSYSDFEIVTLGGDSVIISVDGTVAAKVSLRLQSDHVESEQSIFKLLQERREHSYLIETFFLCPGFAHGDINSRNILVNDKNQLKLTDLDHVLRFGERVDVGGEPYTTQCHGATVVGQYGMAGPGIEQLALGSIFWYITRGTEVDDKFPGWEMVTHFIRKDYPVMDHDEPVDQVIHGC
ncbi:hypothetical protein M501DRAFT_986986 [Patellaria atrata CBS 101060]|uniref:Protein kinase domain-containing protein n=1 Tax=Patellaria atrata CBS 101060 TaxID=1346257 RepID=A0A9P4S668_9PEZI|nr:hypothetical protein M501DRAFT_986986 [Patellaria atrata CBS 101060]